MLWCYDWYSIRIWHSIQGAVPNWMDWGPLSCCSWAIRRLWLWVPLLHLSISNSTMSGYAPTGCISAAAVGVAITDAILSAKADIFIVQLSEWSYSRQWATARRPCFVYKRIHDLWLPYPHNRLLAQANLLSYDGYFRFCKQRVPFPADRNAPMCNINDYAIDRATDHAPLWMYMRTWI